MIANNTFYKSLIQLNYSSFITITGFLFIYNNHVRIIFKIVEGSYIKLTFHSVLVAEHNVVYTVFAQEMIHNPRQSCYFQSCLDLPSKRTSCRFKIVIVNNKYTAPLHLSAYQTYFKNCEWDIDKNAHAKPDDILLQPINVSESILSISKDNIGIIPSSICKCHDSSKYECKSHRLSQVFPGQTITINLIVPNLISSSSNTVILVVETAHLPPYGCRITKPTEMSQINTNTGCNQYGYTKWSDKTECKLYLSAEGISEKFYVKLLPCPVGFSLQKDFKKCHCDAKLNCDIFSVTKCNINEGTILRPANSWISADTCNGSHRYHASSQCPFDYCVRTSLVIP